MGDALAASAATGTDAVSLQSAPVGETETDATDGERTGDDADGEGDEDEEDNATDNDSVSNLSAMNDLSLSTFDVFGDGSVNPEVLKLKRKRKNLRKGIMKRFRKIKARVQRMSRSGASIDGLTSLDSSSLVSPTDSLSSSLSSSLAGPTSDGMCLVARGFIDLTSIEQGGRQVCAGNWRLADRPMILTPPNSASLPPAGAATLVS